MKTATFGQLSSLSNQDIDAHIKKMGAISQDQMANAGLAGNAAGCNNAPVELEIPRLVSQLFRQTEILSMRIAELGMKLTPVSTSSAPDCSRPSPPFETELGRALAENVTRLETMSFAVVAMIDALAL